MLMKPLYEAFPTKMVVIPKAILVLGRNTHTVPGHGFLVLLLAKEYESFQIIT